MWNYLSASVCRSVGNMVRATMLSLGVRTVAEATTFRLRWHANQDTVTAGYFVFYGTSPGTYQPSQGIDVGNVTEFQVNLTPGQTYYFMVRAYTSANVFGAASAELTFLTPPDPSVSV